MTGEAGCGRGKNWSCAHARPRARCLPDSLTSQIRSTQGTHIYLICTLRLAVADGLPTAQIGGYLRYAQARANYRASEADDCRRAGACASMAYGVRRRVRNYYPTTRNRSLLVRCSAGRRSGPLSWPGRRGLGHSGSGLRFQSQPARTPQRYDPAHCHPGRDPQRLKRSLNQAVT